MLQQENLLSFITNNQPPDIYLFRCLSYHFHYFQLPTFKPNTLYRNGHPTSSDFDSLRGHF